MSLKPESQILPCDKTGTCDGCGTHAKLWAMSHGKFACYSCYYKTMEPGGLKGYVDHGGY